jgi:hypothetical protein
MHVDVGEPGADQPAGAVDHAGAFCTQAGTGPGDAPVANEDVPLANGPCRRDQASFQYQVIPHSGQNYSISLFPTNFFKGIINIRVVDKKGKSFCRGR